MTINSQLSTTEPKKEQKQKLSKQPEQEQNQRNGHHTEGFQWGGGKQEWGERYREEEEELVGIKQMGREKNGIGNTGLKELICATHEHWVSPQN